jgi:hypothetical protein
MKMRWASVVVAVGVLSGSSAAQEPPGWFEGTIVERNKVVAKVPKALLGTAVHTTLSATRIRRETSLQVAKLSTGTSGIIVDLDQKEATLYRTDLLQKYYCTIALADLDKVVRAEKVEDFIGGRERGYSRVFLPLLMGAYEAETTKDAVTVLNRVCDRIIVSQGIRRWRIASCREIRVHEALVKAVYPRIPKEVTGYPLEIIGEVVRGSDPIDLTQFPPWLRKVVQNMDKINDALSLQESTATEITPKKLPADAFTLDGSFKKLNSLEELDAKFPEGKKDFDD